MDVVSYLTINGETREIVDAQSRDNFNSLEDRIKILELITDAPNFTFDMNDYRQLSTVARRGEASDYIGIGDQVIVPWSPDSNIAVSYNLPFDVVAIDLPVIDGYGREVSNNIWLQSHYALTSMPYSGVGNNSNSAFYVPAEKMTAGTYYFTALASAGPFTNGQNYSFTLTQEVPSKGQLVFDTGASIWPSSLSSWKVSSYSSGIESTPIETVVLNTGESGTKIGELKTSGVYSPTGMNTINRIRYGYNRYRFSIPRQWCNGVEKDGNWWSPLNSFERRPASIKTIQGFMTGLPEEFLNVIKPIRITSKLNTISDVDLGSTETVTDYFFLSSLKQENFYVDSIGEPVWPYWSGASSSAHIRYGYDTPTTTKKTVWTRSVYPSSEYNQRYITTGGSYSSTYSSNSYGIAPACVIF